MELISYAMDFVSFYMQKTKQREKIKSIILFGSVARNEEEKDSDVDLFIEVVDNEDKIEKEILKTKDKFLNSKKFRDYWELLDIKNDLHLVVGKLEEWNLKDAMLGSSIILYEKYSPKLENGKNMTILSWSVIKNNSKRVMLNKKIFGYNYYGKRYKGLLEIYNGAKIGSNVIMLPIEHFRDVLKVFRKFKINTKIYKVFEYED